MKIQQFIVLATIAFSCAVALDVNINSRMPQCFFIELDANESMTTKYEVTGYKADEFLFAVYDDFSSPTLKPSYEVRKAKNHTYTLTAKEQKEYKICFTSLDNSGKMLQFEFHKQTEGVDSYTDDKILQNAFNDSVSAYYSLNEIYTSLRHNLMKIEVQSKKSTENKVKWCSIIKMVLMISITTIQIVFLTGLFKDSSPLGI